MQTKKEIATGRKKHLREVNFQGEILRDENFQGIAIISCDTHLIGGHKLAVWPLEATECFIGLL